MIKLNYLDELREEQSMHIVDERSIGFLISMFPLADVTKDMVTVDATGDGLMLLSDLNTHEDILLDFFNEENIYGTLGPVVDTVFKDLKEVARHILKYADDIESAEYYTDTLLLTEQELEKILTASSARGYSQLNRYVKLDNDIFYILDGTLL